MLRIQWDHAGLHDGAVLTVVIASPSPGTPSQIADGDSHVDHAAVLTSVASPQPEDVAFTGHRHADHDVDRTVGDLPVTDLDVQGVDEDHRIHAPAIQRPVALGRV